MLPTPTKLPAGMSSFERIRQDGFIYVDKTRLIHRLATEGTVYFLSRPRRFGKSLLIDTLRLLFLGRRDLFANLWIDAEGRWDWTPHPVITLDFNTIIFETPEKMRTSLSACFQEQAGRAGFALTTIEPPDQIRELIRLLFEKTGRPVVFLVDEYDKSILDFLPDDLDTARANRAILKNLFRVLKGVEVAPLLRFALFTGVTKFSKVSIFSDLNQLSDISLEGDYADLLGWTQEEVETNFPERIAKLATKLNLTLPQTLDKLRVKYNGYRFSAAPIRVYNPYSLLRSFGACELGHFWFSSGTPTFLVNLIAQKNFPPPWPNA